MALTCFASVIVNGDIYQQAAGGDVFMFVSFVFLLKVFVVFKFGFNIFTNQLSSNRLPAVSSHTNEANAVLISLFSKGPSVFCLKRLSGN